MAPNRSAASTKPAKPLPVEAEADPTAIHQMIYSKTGKERQVFSTAELESWLAKGWLEEPPDCHPSIAPIQ